MFPGDVGRLDGSVRSLDRHADASRLHEYGRLATEYMREFDRRWLRPADREGGAMLGSGDIQSLADLGNAFGVIREMKAVPFGRDTFVQFTMATVVPFAPLLFTMFPLGEMLNRIIGAVF